jgi:hypothetical protein
VGKNGTVRHLFVAAIEGRSMSVASSLVTHPQQVGFCALVLLRMKGLIEWLRQQPVPAGNVVEEALSLAFAMAQGAPFDVQRVHELVAVETGSNGVMVWKDGEAKIVGGAIDLVLRAIARSDQAASCASRIADRMMALHDFEFADPRTAVEAERQHLDRLAQAVGAERGPVGPAILQRVPEYARGPLAPHAAGKIGHEWYPSFGAQAASFPGPDWEDPFDDGALRDGRDPQTTRKGHVEGW